MYSRRVFNQVNISDSTHISAIWRTYPLTIGVFKARARQSTRNGCNYPHRFGSVVISHLTGCAMASFSDTPESFGNCHDAAELHDFREASM